MTQQKCTDASDVEFALKNHFESKYGKKLLNVKFRSVYYQGGSVRDIWEADGDIILKGFLWSKKRQSFRYQVDPKSGKIIGYQEVGR